MTDTTPASTPSAAGHPSRAERRPSRRRTSRLPLTIRYGLPLAAVVLATLWVRDTWTASRAMLYVVDAEDAALDVRGGSYQLFPFDPSPSAPSPPDPLGPPIDFAGSEFRVPAEDLPGRALLRVEAPGYGVTYVDAAAGDDAYVRLAPPVTVHGRIVDEGGTPVDAAAVTVLGGSARGIRLASASSAGDGSFTVDTVAATVKSWCFRVLAEGFEVQNREWLLDPDEPPVVTLRRTAPVRGHLLPPPVNADQADAPAFELGGWEVRVFHLPGVATQTAADGSFELDHLPPTPMRAHLLFDLPPDYTHRRATVQAGQGDVQVQVLPAVTVRGRVINGHSKEGVAQARVFHDHGPDGMEVVVSAADGSFELPRVPPGPVQVQALYRVPRSRLPLERRREIEPERRFVDVQGSVSVTAVAGEAHDDVEIVIW